MEPYRTDRPKVYADMPNSLTALLGRLADAGIPLTHTLYEYAMNPDAPISTTAQNLTDEFVPFKYQIRSGEATPSSLAKEALLMFSPQKGGRRAVRRNPDGSFNSLDIGAWNAQKELQLRRVERKLYNRDPSAAIPNIQYQIDLKLHNIERYKDIVNDPTYPEWQRADAKKQIKAWQVEINKLQNEITERTINSIDYNGMPYNEFVKNYSERNAFTNRPKFIDRALDNEGVKYKADVLDDGYKAFMINNWQPPEY